MGAQGSYSDTLKSTGLIGGSQVIALGINMFRTKAMAELLGPSGIALFGLYSSAIGLIATLTGMGISSSGVRQIAEARGAGDMARVTQTAVSLRRVTLALGLLGAIVVFLLRDALSIAAFETDEHSWAFGLLAGMLFLQTLGGGLGALIQGSRRIRDLAVSRILGAVWGVLIAVPIIYFMGEWGVAWSMLAGTLAATATTAWFASRIRLDPAPVPLSATWRESRALMSLGLVFVANGLMISSVAYGSKIYVTRELGLEALGLFQASTGLSSLLVNMVLQAMGADFYPRLTGVATDNAKVGQLVNEQAEVSLLLAAPGVIATIALAPYVLYIFYSDEFVSAADILRWQILGVFARVICWPMGFVSLAKGAKGYFLGLQIWANIAHIGFLILMVSLLGLIGLGVAFFLLYVVHIIPVYLVARRLSGFTWSRANIRHWMVVVPPLAGVFLASLFLDPLIVLIAGALATAGTAYYSLRQLHNMVGAPGARRVINAFSRRLPPSIRRIIFALPTKPS